MIMGIPGGSTLFATSERLGEGNGQLRKLQLLKFQLEAAIALFHPPCSRQNLSMWFSLLIDKLVGKKFVSSLI